jgi:polysaccharide deacetylase 2 family uncharacterized protein YibQ
MARRRRSSSGRSPAGGILLFLLGILLGAGIFYLACNRQPGRSGMGGEDGPRNGEDSRERPAKQPNPDKTDAAQDDESDLDQAPTTTVAGASVPGGKVRAAIVIDDLGHDTAELRPLEGLGIPLSYSVLPFLEATPEVVAELRQRRAEILCHLPMEPLSGQQDPGPGALRLGMSEEELRRLTLAALAAVPGATGVNNHMGSGLSASEPAMRAILGVLAAHKLFFLDSRTSAQSVGFRVATELGMPAAERQVFLDDDPTPTAIEAQFDRFLALAKSRGAAIAIGHPHPATLETLARRVPEAKAQGVTFVPVSYLLDRPGEVQ